MKHPSIELIRIVITLATLSHKNMFDKVSYTCPFCLWGYIWMMKIFVFKQDLIIFRQVRDVKLNELLSSYSSQASIRWTRKETQNWGNCESCGFEVLHLASVKLVIFKKLPCNRSKSPVDRYTFAIWHDSYQIRILRKLTAHPMIYIDHPTKKEALLFWYDF